MKRIYLTLIAVFLLAAIPLSSASADNWNWQHHDSKVFGVVTDNGKDVKNAKVEVTCNGHHEWARTNRHGWYEVDFHSWQCSKGSTVTVNVTYKGLNGQNSGKIDHDYDADINVALMSVAVPEFGMLTAGGASIAGLSTVLFVRKKNLSRSKA